MGWRERKAEDGGGETEAGKLEIIMCQINILACKPDLDFLVLVMQCVVYTHHRALLKSSGAFRFLQFYVYRMYRQTSQTKANLADL